MHTQIDKVRKFPYDSGIVIRSTAMPDIHEVATLTSKGQLTLPKSIRQALGVDTGGRRHPFALEQRKEHGGPRKTGQSGEPFGLFR